MKGKTPWNFSECSAWYSRTCRKGGKRAAPVVSPPVAMRRPIAAQDEPKLRECRIEQARAEG